MESFSPPVRDLTNQVRRVIRELVPELDERIYPGWKLIGLRVPDGRRFRYVGYLFPSADRVVLGFEYGTVMADPDGILKGTGSQVRIIDISSRKDVQRERLAPYILEAVHIAIHKKGATSVKSSRSPRRCPWAGTDPLYVAYHDREWGVPVHNDRKLFEMLILEGAQAGLSWITILRKRSNYRKAFDRFDARIIARYNAKKIAKLLRDEGIVRNRLKIRAAVTNARAFLAIQKEFGSFDAYIWQFVGGTPRVNRWSALKDLPARTTESDAMSKDLKHRGFSFVGSTICYAFMQATGMVNDHVRTCYRYQELGGKR